MTVYSLPLKAGNPLAGSLSLKLTMKKPASKLDETVLVVEEPVECPPSSEDIIVLDEFIDPDLTQLLDHIPDVGGSWSAFKTDSDLAVNNYTGDGTNAEIVGGEWHITANDYSLLTPLARPDTPDYYMVEKIRFGADLTTGSGNFLMGARLRTDSTNAWVQGYFVEENVRLDGVHVVHLWKTIDVNDDWPPDTVILGTPVMAAGAPHMQAIEWVVDPAPLANEPHSLKFALEGKVLKVWWDGVLRLQGEDTTFPEPGQVGFLQWGAFDKKINSVLAKKFISTEWFLDNFTGTGLLTGHTTDSGHLWSIASFWQGGITNALILDSGLIKIDGSLLGGNAYGEAIANVVPPSANYYVEGLFQGTDFGTGDVFLGGRFSATAGGSDAEGYTVEWANGGPGTVNFELGYVNVANGATAITNADASVGATFRVRLEMKGTTIRVLVNGVQIISVTDSTVTQVGAPYFYLEPSGAIDADRCKFDYIKAGSV